MWKINLKVTSLLSSFLCSKAWVMTSVKNRLMCDFVIEIPNLLYNFAIPGTRTVVIGTRDDTRDKYTKLYGCSKTYVKERLQNWRNESHKPLQLLFRWQLYHNTRDLSRNNHAWLKCTAQTTEPQGEEPKELSMKVGNEYLLKMTSFCKEHWQS